MNEMKYEVEGMEIELKEIEDGLYDIYLDGKLDGRFECVCDTFWVLTSDRFCIDIQLCDRAKFSDTIDDMLMEYELAKIEEDLDNELK